MNQDNVVMVFIPGFIEKFELTYINLINELHKCNVNASIYTLKTKFHQIGDVAEVANYYIDELEKLNLLRHKVILCGFSAGGVIAYFMAKQLPHSVERLILFDAYFYKISYYSQFKNFVRAKLNMCTYDNLKWRGDLPILNTPILYFSALSDQMHAGYKLSRRINFYYLRQMKANLEYCILMLVRKFKLPNGLKKHMNIKKIHLLNASHSGSDGILTSKHLPEIVQIIQDDIKDI
jgi:hypothetical protein